MGTLRSAPQVHRAFIISGHALFAEAIARLLQDAGVQVVGRADSLESALPELERQAMEAIIVDQDDPQLHDAEVVSRLVGHDEERQVIFLTLAGNRMIVHHRERLENITPADLVGAIRVQRQRP
jgi:DNA-binding NarL/FixJ family response regulator